jgi:dTDP-4-amino-4,6-dideoxygalactose transaminase
MILMNDFRAEPQALCDAEMEAVRRVLDSGRYVLGEEVTSFEREWAARCATRQAVGVGNGLDAISIGLRCLGIGPGDEVITTPMTAFATAAAILLVGATPVFADIDPHDGLLDIDSASRCLSPRTRGVMPVHLYGRIGDMGRWLAFCRDASIQLIEDCAQAHLARWNGGPAGSFGAFGAYSFYPTKNLGARGDAGALVTCDGELAARAARLRNYGQSERYQHPELGVNSRLDELHAAILRARLGWLDEFTARRRTIARRLSAGIDNPAVKPLRAAAREEQDVHHLFVVNSPERDRLAEHLRRCEVQTLIHYPMAVHEQPPCRGLPRDPLGLPNAEHHARSCLSLPCHPQLSDAEVSRIVEAVNAFG